MQKIFFILLFLLPLICFGQNDTTVSITKEKKAAKWHSDESSDMNVFHSQKLINANTVEVLPKGIMEFRVAHAFGDIAGHDGGIKPFFGLESAYDVRIGVQVGLTDKLNVILARAKGGGTPNAPAQLYELGLKYQFMKQENDSRHPFSLTLFANSVVSSMVADTTPGLESSFSKFSDRTSEVIQLMIARKFGKISLQLSPTYLTRGYVINGDDKNLFALGGAVRIPLTSRFIFIADYFHTFRSQKSKDTFADPSQVVPLKFYDALGVGFEILTAGHVFHLNFTNATDLLENRFIPHTFKSWSKGGFRWSFTISRNFTIFRDKKNK
ncbi:MAG: hypothetical protein JWM28_581 [Chitinophagaceae bacterium]|nr:hypothetical protein [Chitinophagaceae bacterium]